MVVLGEGQYKYEVVEGWGKLPGWVVVQGVRRSWL